MSKERVQEILSHVDMSKIDLTSFKLSEKKFDELATLYRNRVILSGMSVLLHKNEHSQEAIDVAFDMVKKVCENPDMYSYGHLYHLEREAVDKAINDITHQRDRNINDLKVKTIERRMKESYKQMRKTIELAMKEDNDFEQEFDDEIVERCLRVTKEAIDEGKRKAAQKVIEECENKIEECQVLAEAQYQAKATAHEIHLTEQNKPQSSIKEKIINKYPWMRIFIRMTN